MEFPEALVTITRAAAARDGDTYGGPPAPPLARVLEAVRVIVATSDGFAVEFAELLQTTYLRSVLSMIGQQVRGGRSVKMSA